MLTIFGAEMYPSTIILCAAAVLLHGVSCHLFPAVLNPLTKADHFKDNHKRQTIAQLQQCITAGVTAALQRNSSSFVSRCTLAATEQITLDPFSSSAQSQVNEIFSSFCIPQCGNVIQDVYEDCGYFDVTPPGNERFLAGLCGTNENGEVCYTLYSDAIDRIESERDCYVNNLATGQCTCRSLLISVVSEQGCCFDAYHDLISAQSGTYNPSGLYSTCNVDRPEDCNNSPISGNNSPTSGPTSGNNSPINGTNSPTSDNSSPTSGNNSPTSGNNSPTSGTNSPTSDNSSPTSSNNSPTSGNNSPINGNNSPTSGNNSPINGNNSPTSGNNSPINGSVSFASTATLIIAMVCFAALG